MVVCICRCLNSSQLSLVVSAKIFPRRVASRDSQLRLSNHWRNSQSEACLSLMRRPPEYFLELHIGLAGVAIHYWSRKSDPNLRQVFSAKMDQLRDEISWTSQDSSFCLDAKKILEPTSLTTSGFLNPEVTCTFMVRCSGWSLPIHGLNSGFCGQ